MDPLRGSIGSWVVGPRQASRELLLSRAGPASFTRLMTLSVIAYLDATSARPEAAKRPGNCGWIAGWWGPMSFAHGAAGTRVPAV
ncbi:Hypothetical protein A7982_10720 [Minicystis rosea]|nr:Hypothetical protein A7982_10720 [Minicystis rosea]